MVSKGAKAGLMVISSLIGYWLGLRQGREIRQALRRTLRAAEARGEYMMAFIHEDVEAAQGERWEGHCDDQSE